MLKKERKQIIDPSFYLDQHQQLKGSILGRDPSSIQVSWKSVVWFLCRPADKPTYRQMCEVLSAESQTPAC